MRIAWAFSVLLFLGYTCVWAQQDKPPTLGKDTEQQQRPTLGEAPEGGGPRTSTTTDMRKLLRVRTVYVEAIDNSLNQKLIEALSKLGPFRVVAKRTEADAFLRGTCFDARRLKRLHSEVFLADPHGASIWQDNINQPFNPPPLEKAVTDSATILVEHLSESLREAQRK